MDSSLFLVLCAWILYVVQGQAPGDHDANCRTGLNLNNHILPAEWRILMDTYDYSSLSSKWVGIASPWSDVGGQCTPSLYVCQPLTNPSSIADSWLFSQHISYQSANEVFFNVSYQFSDCHSIPTCTIPYVTVYRYDRNTTATNSERTNTNNYQPSFGTAASSRLEHPSGSTAQIQETRSFTRPASSTGFYLGVGDEGTCGSLNRIIVYYVVCPGRVDGLVTYPETAVPVQGSSDIIFDAVCAANAHNTSSRQVRASSSSSTCSDIAPGGVQCQCNAGYLTSGDGVSCGGEYESCA